MRRWREQRGERRSVRFSVRPTPRGWQAIIIGALVLVVARVIGTTQFHQLGYALLVLPVASFVLGYLASRGIGFSRSLPPGERLSAGKTARINVLLSNDSRLDTSRLEITDRLPDAREIQTTPLRSGGGTAVEVPVSFARRGVYELGPAEVRMTDPFGLLRFARRFVRKTEVVVYPEVHDLAGFPLSGGNVEAGSRGARGQRGDEFAGLREYRRGDDQRHIHWKSVARTGELFVKEFALEAPRRYTVALDLRRSGIRAVEAEIEDAVSAAASVLTHLKMERLPARLLCNDRTVGTTEFASDEAAYWRAMRILATVRADGEALLSETVTEERASLGEGAVLISRTRDESLAGCVRKLRGAGLSVVVVMLAAHTYRGFPTGHSGGREAERESEFQREVGRLEAAGAAVRVMRRQDGVARLASGRRRERGAVS
ncbi:MAG TPA: DUF58 domain-containing protein [Rubrobacteraceae bacterium]|nr:DUF58 domain-containing protein [Rubrobacteraceae bacterium]